MPVATAELKNQLTGQRAADAVKPLADDTVRLGREIVLDVGQRYPRWLPSLFQEPSEFCGFEHREARQLIDEFPYVSHGAILSAPVIGRS